MLKLFFVACFSVLCVASANLFAQVTFTGQVINPDGSPAQQAQVKLYDFMLPSAKQRVATTDANGRFEFADIAKENAGRLGLRATSQDARFCGMIARGTVAPKGQPVETKLQLEEAWNFHLDVVDQNSSPVDAAVALVELPDFEFFETRTNAAGRAEYVLPRSASVKAVAAWKDNIGFDFHSYTKAMMRGDAPSKLPIQHPEESAEKLVLAGARKVVIQIVDDQGVPIRKASVSPAVFYSSDEPSTFTPPNGVGRSTADDSGVVKIDWLSTKTKQLYLSASAEPNFLRNSQSHSLSEEPITITLERPAKISGRVTDRDGKPKAGIKVVTKGQTFDDTFEESATTDNDGNYELHVRPNGAYIVGIDDKQFAAPARDGIVVPRGSAIHSIDFQLSQPSGIFGRLLDVFTRKPVANESIRLVSQARELAQEELALLDKPAKATRTALRPRLTISAKTDADGRYEFAAAPGEYQIEYMNQIRDQMIGTSKTNVDLPAKVKVLSKFSGVVINKATGEPIPKAIVYDTGYSATWQATTDAQGKFTVERALEDGFLIAYTKGYTVVGIAHVKAGDTEARFECLETGSVRGKFASHDGKPLPKRKLEYQLPMRSESSPWGGAVSKSIETNDEGEFIIKPIFAGYEYYLGTPTTAGRMDELTKFKIEPGQTLDLGTIKE